MSPLLFLLLLCLHLTNAQLFDNDNSNSDQQDNLNIEKSSQTNPNQQQPVEGNDKPSHKPLPNNNIINMIDKDELEDVLLNEDVNPININNNNNKGDIDTDNNNKGAIDKENNKDNNKKDKATPEPKKKKTTNQAPPSQSKYAWVTMIDRNITSVASARVLSQSLSKHKSTADRILICEPGVSDKAINMLKNFGWKIHSIDVNMFGRISNYPENIRLELLKILMFNFTEYSSVGYLSPQSMVTTNIDHLFKCGTEALCGTPNDKHHQIYHNNQRHSKKLLAIENGKFINDNVEYIVYDNNGNMINNEPKFVMGNHESVFDDNIFLMTPEHDLYVDMFTFITSAHDEMEGLQNDEMEGLQLQRMDFPSYLSEYFYHYCKGNGYPISKQNGQYIPPKVRFNCSDEFDCKMSKDISKSPCYMLEEGYNFHPSHNDHISSSWHWKQSMKHLTIKIIQYSSYFNADTHRDMKPWKWRYVLFSGWMIEFNTYASIEPNLYFEYLLLVDNNKEANGELLMSLWQKPVLYMLVVVVLMSAFTNLSTPMFNIFLMGIHKLSKSSPGFIQVMVEIYKWIIFPFLLIWSVLIVITPMKQIFIDQEIIPEAYPFKLGWILALQYCYFTSCFKFVITCFVMFWIGRLYHPIVFKIRWFDYLQLKLFAFNLREKYYYISQRNRSPSRDIETGGKYFGYSDSQLANKFKRKGVNIGGEDVWFTRMIVKPQNLLSKLQNKILKYVSVLVLLVLKWCLWYLFCIVIILSTIWILRFNDWHELRVIVGTESVFAISWISYCAVNTYCQFFIYPQIAKYGEKYYDSHAFEKGI